MKALQQKTALITGAGQGLGREIALHFARAGASLWLVARTEADLKKVQQELGPLLKDGQQVQIAVADIGNTQSVDTLVVKIIADGNTLDILVNNAGVYGPIGALEEIDWQEWLDAITINLTGTIYLTRAIIPHMKQKKRGKMIFLSGGGATNPLPGISAYAASKAAIVRMVETLALELAPWGIDVNAVAPGALATRLTDQLLAAGSDKVGKALFDKMTKVKVEGGTPLSVGAELCVYLASEVSNGISGKLISAPWDDWKNLHTHREELQHSDIYALRRIIPKDRGKGWGEV